MTELLSYGSGILFSILFGFVPGASNWYDTLDGTYKRLVMLGSLILVTAIIVAMSCFGWYDNTYCTETGYKEIAKSFLEILVMASIANQTTFVVTKSYIEKRINKNG